LLNLLEGFGHRLRVLRCAHRRIGADPLGAMRMIGIGTFFHVGIVAAGKELALPVYVRKQSFAVILMKIIGWCHIFESILSNPCFILALLFILPNQECFSHLLPKKYPH
jgi:hypothetical protein